MGSVDEDNVSQESVGVVMDGSTLPEVVMARDSDGRKKSFAADATYQVYRQRWFVLLTVVLLNISNAGVSTVVRGALYYLLAS